VSARSPARGTVPFPIVATHQSPPVPPSAGLPARTRLAAGAGTAVAGLSRLLGRGGGSVVGGRATLALDPRALEHLAAGHAVGLVSGTNGKTTTTSLLRAGLATTGPVVTNLLGANLPPGLTSALVGSPPGAPAALEVDEAWLGRVVDATAPAVVLLLNLSRDQLDRNNEVRRLASSWRAIFAGRSGTTVVANADDPLVVWGAGAADDVVWVAAGQPWTADASGCPKCGARILFSPTAGAAAGAAAGGAAGAAGAAPGWACSSCDLRRPDLAVTIEDGRVVSTDGWSVSLRLALPGRCNQANAAIALAAAVRMGADPVAAMEAMASTAEVVGRYRTVDAGGVDARLLLSKNPAGWLELFDILAPPPGPVVVAINARIADGRDPSWLWDVPFERLAGRLVVASGERSADLAVRLHYAEIDHVRIPDPVEAVREAGRHAAALTTTDARRPAVDVVANYTSFQELRSRLGVA
jgi:UDP-N-acetylmuramyl tripeptide synthase